MRNFITPAPFDLANAPMETRFEAHAAPAGLRARPVLDHVRDDRHRLGDTRNDPRAGSTPSVSAFEGFGSFSG